MADYDLNKLLSTLGTGASLINPAIGPIVAGVGALGSLISKDDDPYAEQRALIKKLMQEVGGQEAAQASGIQMRGAQNLGLLQNQIRDQGAAAGIPENVTTQNLITASLGARDNVEQALVGLKERTFGQKAQLAGMMPMQERENPWSTIMGIGGQMMMSDPNSLKFVSNLFGGGNNPYNGIKWETAKPNKLGAGAGVTQGDRDFMRLYGNGR